MVSEITFSILVSILLSICLYFYYKVPTKIKTKGISFEALLTFLKTITKLHYFDFKDKNVEHYKILSKNIVTSSLKFFSSLKNIIQSSLYSLLKFILHVTSTILLLGCYTFILILSNIYAILLKLAKFITYMFVF